MLDMNTAMKASCQRNELLALAPEIEIGTDQNCAWTDFRKGSKTHADLVRSASIQEMQSYSKGIGALLKRSNFRFGIGVLGIDDHRHQGGVRSHLMQHFNALLDQVGM